MDTLNLQTCLFWALAGMTGVCALMVVLTQNIVRAAAWLLFTLGGTAGVFFLLGADFIGATQLLVYVGGTLVLVVFGVMLTAAGPFITMKASAGEWAVGVLVGAMLYGIIAFAVGSREAWANVAAEPNAADSPAASLETAILGGALMNNTYASPEAKVTGLPPGKSMDRTAVGYLLPFEIVSVHLLVVLIGAAYLARAKRRRGAVA